MASAQPEEDFDIRKRWLRYKDTMNRNAPHALKLMTQLHVFELKMLLRAGKLMDFEFHFIDVDANIPGRKIVARLWKTLTFRPDMARTVERLCRGEERINQTPFADLLRQAIEAAGWPEDIWSRPSQTTSSLPDLRLTGDALAGLATICCDDLKRHNILSIESADAVSKEAEFSEARGRLLARQLTLQGWKRLQDFIKKKTGNRFLLRVFDAAAQGRWAGPAAFSSNLPDLPNYTTERDCFRESREKLKEVVDSEEQVWIDIWGPRGAGKTTAAVHLVNRVPHGQTALWFSFGEKRGQDEIYNSARSVVENCFPKSDLSKNPDPKIFLKETLTFEKTKDFIFFLDDVCDANVLDPFGGVKTAVITSPILVEYRTAKKTLDVSVPLSLTEKESVDVVEKILEEKYSSIEGHEHLTAILRTTLFNALATSVLASHIKSIEREKWSERFFKELREGIEKNAMDFNDLSEEMKERRGHEYTSEDEKMHLGVYSVIKFIIENSLSDKLREAFDSLIVFPRDTPIEGHVFQKINNHPKRLDILFDRSLLGKIGEDFSLHGLIRDVLEDNLNNDEKKKFFEKLVSAYEADDQIKENDTFYLLHFIPTCVNAERRDVANRLMSSAHFLLWRFFQTRFTNLFNDFAAVMSGSEEPNDAVDSFRNFFCDPQLWNQGFDKKTLLRQALLFKRCEHVDRELQSLLQKEEYLVELPLFRARREKSEEIRGFEEVSRLVSGTQKRNLAVRNDGFSIATHGDAPSDVLKPIFALGQDKLVQLMERRMTLDDFFAFIESKAIFLKKILGLSEAIKRRPLLQRLFQLEQISHFANFPPGKQNMRAAVAFFKSMLPHRHVGEAHFVQYGFQNAVRGVLVRLDKTPEDKSLREILEELLDVTSKHNLSSIFADDRFQQFFDNLQKMLENVLFDFPDTELLLFGPQLSGCGKSAYSKIVLCSVASSEKRWLQVTSNAFVVLGSDLSVVVRCEIHGEVIKATVDPSGCLAAVWTEGRTLILFRTALEEEEDISAVIPDGWEVLSLAVTVSAVAALCKTEKKELHRLLIWNIEDDEKLEQRVESNILHVAFLEEDQMALCGKDKLHLYNWKSGTELSSIDEKCDFIKSSPNGKLFAVASRIEVMGVSLPSFHSFKVFDCNSLQTLLSSDDYNLGSLSDFALSDSYVIANSRSNTELVVFRRNELTAVIPRVQPLQLSIRGARDIAELQDLTFFLSEGNHCVLRALENDSVLCRVDCTDWKSTGFVYFEDGVAVFEENGHRLALLNANERCSEQYSIEEAITAVASKNSHSVAVGTSGGQILVPQGSQWREVARCEGPIADLFLFEDGIGVRLRNETFRIFSLGGQELFSQEGVDDVHLAPCRKRAALKMPLQSVKVSECQSVALEVSQEGRELRRNQHSSLYRAQCIPNGLLSWDFSGHAIIKEEGKEERTLQVPGGAYPFQVLDDGHHALFMNDIQLWIMDLRTGKKELVLDRYVAGTPVLVNLFTSPCAQSVLGTTYSNGHFLLKNLPRPAVSSPAKDVRRDESNAP